MRHGNTQHSAGALAEGFVLAGAWYVQPSTNRIFNGERQFQIPDKFMRVLLCLAERPGVVTREELLETVWAGSVVVEESLTRAISELRKVFNDDPRQPRIIETITKKGYRLIADVRLQPPSTSTSPGAIPGGGAPHAVATDLAAKRLKRPGMRYTQLLLPAGILAAVLLIWTLFRPTPHPQDPVPHTRQLTSLHGRESYPALSADGRQLAFVWDGGGSRNAAIMAMAVGSQRPLVLTDAPGHYSFPTWSHDSRQVAFTRQSASGSGIFAIPALGGPERLLVPAAGTSLPVTPDFSPDGTQLAYAMAVREAGPYSIFVSSLDTGATRRLSSFEQDGDRDYRPRFSPDGTRIAFIRIRAGGPMIAVMPIQGGRPRLLDPGDRALVDIAWSPDGREIDFMAGDGLWRIPVGGGAPRLLSAALHAPWSTLSQAREVRLLAYAEMIEERNIWHFAYEPDAPRVHPPAELISSSRYDARPAYSRDGQKIAFVSDRSGFAQVWIAESDGSAPRQMTGFKGCFVVDPAWSPCNQRLAFVAYPNGWANLTLLDLPTGVMRVISSSPSTDLAPSWSADGRWIYFSSDRSGSQEIWKAPVAGGDALQITSGGGHRARESVDGTRLYYSQSYRDSLGVWSVAVGGGEPPVLAFHLAEGRLADWDLGAEGLFYCYGFTHTEEGFVVGFHKWATGETTRLFTIASRAAPRMDVHPDGRQLIFDQTSRFESDIVAIEGL